MNTKTTKFLAVLAVLAMAFAAVAVITTEEQSDAVPAKVAKVGVTEYETLAEALTAATSGQTVEVIANCSIATGTVKADTTLFIPEGMTVQITTLLTVLGTITNDGIINNASDGDSPYQATKGLVLPYDAASPKITSSGADVKGTITGTNIPLVSINSGVLENQIIDATDYTAGQQCIDSSNINEKTVTIQNNLIKVDATARHAVDAQLKNVAGKFNFLNNIVDSVDETIKSVILVYADLAGVTGTAFTITGNTFNVKIMDFGDGGRILGLCNAGAAYTVSSTGTPTVKIDSSVSNIKANTTNWTISGTVTVDRFAVEAAMTATIDTDAKLIVNEAFNNAGTLVNKGTFDDCGTIAALGTFNNTNGKVIVHNAADSTIFSAVGGTVEVATEDGSDREVVVNPAFINNPVVTEAMFTGHTGEAIITNVAVTSAVIPADTTLVLNDSSALTAASVLDVSNDGAQIAVMNAAGKSFQVDIGGTENVTVTGLSGTVTFSKGSIVVETKNWSAGTITLNPGDELKISGDANIPDATTLKILLSDEDKTATLNVLADKELEINAVGTGKLIIGKGITVNVYGTVTGTVAAADALDIKEKMNIYDGGVVDITKMTVKTLNVNSGATLEGTVVVSTAATVYSGSDINGLTGITWTKVTGKDAASGKWTYDGEGKLTLNNYNGTYNFGAIAGAITTIEVIGDNVVSYAVPAPANLFGAVGDITADTGSLTVNVDVSALTELQMAAGFSVFYKFGNVNINQADLFVNVSGSNNTWTADCIKTAAIKGVYMTGNLTVYNASLGINVLGTMISEDAGAVFGLVATNISATSSDLGVVSAGYGIAGGIALDPTVPVTDITIMSATGEIYVAGGVNSVLATTMKIQKADLEMLGDATIGTFTVTNESELAVIGKLIATNMTVDKKSVVTLEDLVIGTKLDNEANVTVTGTSVINGTLTNKNTETGNPVFVNDGAMYVYGHILNEKGTFTNNGTLTVQKYDFNALAVDKKDFAIDNTAATAGKAKIDAIELTKVEMGADGTAYVEATITFNKTDPAGIPTEIPEEAKKFTGTMSFNQLNGSYTLTLRNGGATIITTHDATKTVTHQIGKDYTLSVSGSVAFTKTADGSSILFDLEASAADAEVTVYEIQDLMNPTGADMKIRAGTFATTGDVKVYSGTYDGVAADGANNFLKKDATYAGDLTVGSIAMYIAGTMNGNITSAGAVEIKGTLDGNLTADSAVVSGTVKNGTITVAHGVDASAGKITDGKIVAKALVNVKEMTGDIEINGKTVDVNVVFKKLTGKIIFNSTYNVDEPEAPATPTTETVTSTMDIAADSQGTTVILKGATNKAGSTAGAPGYFILNKDSLDATTDKVVDIKLTTGKLVVAETTVLMKGYVLTIEADTTLEIIDKNATLNVSGAALKVSDSAVKHFEEGSATPVTYGKVSYIMKFPISGGYTIYSNIAYALSNSDAGSTLTMGQSDTVDSNVTIGEGIKVIVPKDIVLTFDGHDVLMADTASIVLEDNGKVIFQASLDNHEDPELEAGDAITYYSVTGTIVFDDANSVEFLGVRFTDNSTIVGVKATETEASKISATLLYKDGTASIATGIGVGTITLTNYSYPANLGDAAADYELGTSVFNVAEGTVFEATAIFDKYGTVDYDDYNVLLEEPKIKTIKSLATTVDIDGTLFLKANNTDAQGLWIVEGVVYMKDKSTFTIYAGEAAVPEGVGKKTAANVSIASLIDTTDNENGYALALVSPILGGEDLVFNAKEYKIEGTNTKVVSIHGGFGLGIITATTCAVLDVLFIDEDAAVIADVTYVMGADESTAYGFLMTKAIYMKEVGVTGYQELDYQVTFEEEGYTVYAYFVNIDFDEISDITIAGSIQLVADAMNPGLMPIGTAKVDLSGKDVNITIADDEALVLNAPLIIGTPITVLGDSGSSIVGKVVIEFGSYLVTYADVDLFDAEILDEAEDDAVYSTLTIEDVLYATVFANEDDPAFTLADVDKKIIPAIIGYNFTKWINLNDDADAAVGDTNAYAGAKAILVSVTVKFAEGVTYYKDGVEFAIYDTPTKIDYGSVFTAKINNTAKYQGTPLINGQNSYIVEDDATLTVSGVTPITPEPTPEPEVGGISLTDILLIVLVILIAVMVVIMVLRLNRS